MAGLMVILAVVLWAQSICNTNSVPALVVGAGALVLAPWRGWSLRAGALTFNAMQAMQLVGEVVMGVVHGSEDYMAHHLVLYEEFVTLRSVTELIFWIAGALCALATDGLPARARGGQLAIAPGLMLLDAVHLRLYTSDWRMCSCLLTYGGGSYVIGASAALGVEALVRKLWRVHEEATAALRTQNEEAIEEATAALRAQNEQLSSAHEQAVAVGMSLAAIAIDANIMLMARGGKSASGDGSDSESGATFFPTEDNGGGERSQGDIIINDGGGSETTEETSAAADAAAVFVDSKEPNLTR